MANSHENIDALINEQSMKDYFELQGRSTGDMFGAYSTQLPMDLKSRGAPERRNGAESGLLDESISYKLLKSLFPPQWGRNYLEADQMMREGYGQHGTMSETLPYFIKGIQSDKNIQTAVEPLKQFLGTNMPLPLKLALDPRVKSILQEHVNKLTTNK
jgi:hypothetical protein